MERFVKNKLDLLAGIRSECSRARGRKTFATARMIGLVSLRASWLTSVGFSVPKQVSLLAG